HSRTRRRRSCRRSSTIVRASRPARRGPGQSRSMATRRSRRAADRWFCRSGYTPHVSVPPTVPSRFARGVRSFYRGPAGRRRLAVAALSIVLSLIPLVGTLGYFGALAMAPIFAWLGAFAGVDAARDDQGRRRPVVEAHRASTAELAKL